MENIQHIIDALQDLADYNRKVGEEDDGFGSYHRGKSDAYSLVLDMLKGNNNG